MNARYQHPCLLLSLLTVVCLGCTQPSTPNKANTNFSGKYPIKATVTVGMVADLVREIGGDKVNVQQLLGSGVDPHLYKPTRDAVQALTNADIVFFNGLMLEGKMAETLHRLEKNKPSVAVAERIPPERLGDNKGEHDHPDPHVWMDVSLWSDAAQVVCDALCEYDPPNAEGYRERTKAVREKLSALHQYGIKQIGCIPNDQRVLVTSHDAFRYFGRAYGIEVQAIQGISTESEAGLQRVNDLVDMLVKRKVKAVFVESSVPKESIEALLKGAESRGHKVEIAGELFSDAMGNEGQYEGTYVGMMDHNLTSIARSLGCPNVPENGFGKP
jgi:manganese/zinc/iron transport system substrate-binding protein